MGFLEATPVGRVLNRFSRDTSMLDSIVYSMMDNFATVAGWCAHAHARERESACHGAMGYVFINMMHDRGGVGTGTRTYSCAPRGTTPPRHED